MISAPVEQLVVHELSTPTIQATLREYAGGPVIPGSALTSITVWLFELVTGTIVNNRDAASLATGLVDENGILQWTLEEDDTALLDLNPFLVSAKDRQYGERYRIEFEIRWDTPERVMRYRVDLVVLAYVKVPVAP